MTDTTPSVREHFHLTFSSFNTVSVHEWGNGAPSSRGMVILGRHGFRVVGERYSTSGDFLELEVRSGVPVIRIQYDDDAGREDFRKVMGILREILETMGVGSDVPVDVHTRGHAWHSTHTFRLSVEELRQTNPMWKIEGVEVHGNVGYDDGYRDCSTVDIGSLEEFRPIFPVRFVLEGEEPFTCFCGEVVDKNNPTHFHDRPHSKRA